MVIALSGPASIPLDAFVTLGGGGGGGGGGGKEREVG